MTTETTDKHIYVCAEDGSVLVYNGNYFTCAYMPIDTDVSQIAEIEESSLVDDSVALQELKEVING